MIDVERARPLLGTRVAIRVEGLPATRAHRAIDCAFAEVEQVHRLLSFHDPDSELSRLNREAALRAQPVHECTHRVLQRAVRLAGASAGRFDPCVAAQLVECGLLPAPAGAVADPAASWRDVHILADRRVHFRRPLWLDVGGIAKGYAVDRATARLRAAGARSGCVDAGGDLRVFGSSAHTILLHTDVPSAALALLQLRSAALASSAGPAPACMDERRSGLVLDGRSRRPVAMGCVSVVASRAWLADALTKPLLADPSACRRLLRAFGAEAFVHSNATGWTRYPA